MPEWTDSDLKSLGPLAIVEYIGPYGAGKTTRLNRDKGELKNSYARIVDRGDFKDFVGGHTKAEKLFILLLSFPLYFLSAVFLLIQSRGALISDRLRRCHLVAMKSIYFRRFMRNDIKIFLSDEGLLHSCCPLFTGAARVPSAWLIRFLYWGLNPVFVRVEVGEAQNIKLLSQREQFREVNNCVVGNVFLHGKFSDLMSSGDVSDIHFLVRESRRFYREVDSVVSSTWRTIYIFPFSESSP